MAAMQSLFRADNRLGREIRPIDFSFDTTPAADGSATCEMGLTVVQVAVYGPRQPSNAARTEEAEVEVEVNVAGFVQGERKKRSKGDRRTAELAAAIKSTFEPVIMTQLYPRSQIDIYVNILAQDGGMLSAAINATTLALIHAGVALTCPLSSIAVSALHDAPLLDPSGTEESDLPTVTVACLASAHSADAATAQDPYSGKVTLVNMETRLSIDRFEGMLMLAVQGCRIISQEMDSVIREWMATTAQKLKMGGGSHGGSTLADGLDIDVA